MEKRDLIFSRYLAACDDNCGGCEFYPIQKERGEKHPSETCFMLAMSCSNSEKTGSAIGVEPWKEKLELPKTSIKEMTLGEIKNYCERVQGENKKCSVCAIKGDFGVCPFDGVKPPMWNLDGPPKFTEEERLAAKVIKDMYPGVVSVCREKRTENLTLVDKFLNSRIINGNMFPTIKVGMSALIDEIIGDGLWDEEIKK